MLIKKGEIFVLRVTDIPRKIIDCIIEYKEILSCYFYFYKVFLVMYAMVA